MHPAYIKALLELKGLSQADIARAVKGRCGKAVTPAAVHFVIHGKSQSKVIAQFISTAIETPVKDLWPNKYPALETIQRAAANGEQAPKKPPTSKPRKAA